VARDIANLFHDVACPSEDTLVAVAEGHLIGDPSATYEHVESCPSCRLLLTELARSYGREEDQARIGQRVGRYELRALLGMGGMGVVYAAHDPELDRDVAIKLLRPDVDTQTQDLRARLLREAQAMARLSHPNVIAVHDVGLHGDQVFIAMELIEGQTLRQWLETQTRSRGDALEVLLQAGRGLAAAHEVGIVHRDFKPDNVMISRKGGVRVLDFGLARAFATTPSSGEMARGLLRSLTGRAGLLGTPAYMAPEQLACEGSDARSDQFSYCVVLFQALTGTRPFGGATPAQLLSAIREGRRDRAAEAKIPSWLRAVIARGLSVDPAQRFASMSELLTALQRDPALRRRRWLSVAALLATCAAAGAISYQQSRRRASLMCQGADARLVGVWNPARKERIHAAFVATKLPYAEEAFTTLTQALDRYANAWQGMYVDACRATRVRGEQSEELLDLRMSCLEQRRGELSALTDLFASADAATVEKAAQAADSLAELGECANIAALKAPLPRPRDPAARAQLEALRLRLAQASALRDSGKYADALRATGPIVSEARALNYAPLTAETLLLVGRIQMWSGDNRAAETSLRAALVAAAEGHHEMVTAQAATTLTYNVGYLLRRHEEGRFWGELAQAVIRAMGANEEATLGRILSNLGTIAYQDGKLDEAVSLAERAAELTGKNEPDSPRLAMMFNNLGVLYQQAGRNVDAEAAMRRQLAIRERTQGPNHPEMAYGLHGLGVLFTLTKRYDEAIPLLQRAIAIRERTLSPTHWLLGMAYTALADTYQRKGDHEQALRWFRRAVENYEQAPDKSKLLAYAGALHGLGQLDLERGRPGAAVATVERSLAIYQTGEAGPPADLGAVKLTLAKALWDSGGDRRRSIDLARQARGVFAAEQRFKAELADVDAWLAMHHR
jgi:tetratricopeptide (TPR) repeat protein